VHLPITSWRGTLTRLGLARRKRRRRRSRLKPRQLQIEALEPRQLLSVAPAGDEFRLNTNTDYLQQLWQDSGRELAALGGGRFVATWGSMNQDGSTWGVFGQRVDASGTKVGQEFQINTETFSEQSRPSVSADDQGNFVVVWQSKHQDGQSAGVFGQRYGADGQPLGDEFPVNTTTVRGQEFPAVTHLAGGGFVVVWSGLGDGDDDGVFARMFRSDGTPLGDEFLVNTTTANQQKSPAVAAMDDGGFLVSWVAHGGQDGSVRGVFARRFDAGGQPLGGEFQVNTTTQNDQLSPAIGVADDGHFVIAWQSKHQDGSAYGIFAQRYTPDGQPVGPEFQVNTVTVSNQQYPSVAFGPGGSFLIAWSGYGTGDNPGIFAREFDADGVPLGEPLLVNTTVGAVQSAAAVAGSPHGYLIGWSGQRADDQYRVFARVLPNTAPTTIGLEDVSVDEDAPPTPIDLFAAFDDEQDADDGLLYQVTSNTNPALLASTDIDPAAGTLTLAYATDAFGTAEITVRASDPGELFVETTFTVDVAPVNDAPTSLGIAAVSVAEDADDTVIDLFAAFDDVDNADAELNYSIELNTNADLFSGMTLDQAVCTLALAYAENASGDASITIRATDPSGAVTDATFPVQVAPVNDVPEALGIPNISVLEDDGATYVDLYRAFQDVEQSPESLTYEIVSNSAPDMVTAVIDGDLGELVFAYQEDTHGTAEIVVRATDGEGLYTENLVIVDVEAVAEAPVIEEFLDAPDPAIEGAGLRLEVEADDDEQVTGVSFFRDADADGVLDRAADQFLGKDTDESDGWGISVITAGFGAGPQTYFAQAVDQEGFLSDVVGTLGGIGIVAVMDDSDLGYEEIGSGWTDGPNEGGLHETYRQHDAGTGTNVARWTFEHMLEGPHRVLVSWIPDVDRATNAPFTVWDGDQMEATIRVNQQQQPDWIFDEGV